MAHKLYVVHGSHPCDTVRKALELKGIPYKVVELTPPTHAPFMRARFGERTVPGIKFEDGRKIQGSRAILRHLDTIVPEPRLAGDERVAEAELWGDEVFQPIARRLLWVAFQRSPRSMGAYQEGQKMPKLPTGVVAAMAPLITKVERSMNNSTDETCRADLRELPAHLDKIDAWIADGVLLGDAPNAADLQIAPTLRLLFTIGDVRPFIEGRPAADLAHRWFSRLPGSVPVGTLPGDWFQTPAVA